MRDSNTIYVVVVRGRFTIGCKSCRVALNAPEAGAMACSGLSDFRERRGSKRFAKYTICVRVRWLLL